MSYRFIHLHYADSDVSLESLFRSLDKVMDYWSVTKENGQFYHVLLARTQDVQDITDHIQNHARKGEIKRIIIHSIEAMLPKPPDENGKKSEDGARKKRFAGVSREELYEDISRGAVLTRNFFLLVILSTIVAAVGLIEDNVAVIIGAMVIAPLLGPNMALALGTALGDTPLIRRSLLANAAGFSLCLALSVSFGYLWPYALDSVEILSRTDVNYGGIVLAIASGAAAALSVVGGMNSALVGVMVAVALLPPATVLGIMLGAAEWELARGAALLLGVNIVAVNLSAKLAFLSKGIMPRTWYEQQKARKARLYYGIFWTISLVLLAGLIWLKTKTP